MIFFEQKAENLSSLMFTFLQFDLMFSSFPLLKGRQNPVKNINNVKCKGTIKLFRLLVSKMYVIYQISQQKIKFT